MVVLNPLKHLVPYLYASAVLTACDLSTQYINLLLICRISSDYFFNSPVFIDVLSSANAICFLLGRKLVFNIIRMQFVLSEL